MLAPDARELRAAAHRPLKTFETFWLVADTDGLTALDICGDVQAKRRCEVTCRLLESGTLTLSCVHDALTLPALLSAAVA